MFRMVKGSSEESGQLEGTFEMKKGRKRRRRDEHIEDSLAKKLFGSSAGLNDDEGSSNEDSPAEEVDTHDTPANESVSCYPIFFSVFVTAEIGAITEGKGARQKKC